MPAPWKPLQVRQRPCVWLERQRWTLESIIPKITNPCQNWHVLAHQNADFSVGIVHVMDQIPGLPLCSLCVSAGLWTLIPDVLSCDVSQFFWGTTGFCQHAPHRCHRRNECVSRSKSAPVYGWPFLPLAVHFSKIQGTGTLDSSHLLSG